MAAISEKLLKTVTHLGSPRVLVAGDFMLDIYTYGDALRISPEAPVPVLKVTGATHSCGGAGAVVTDITALGGSAVCLGTVGDDHNSRILLNLLEEANADTSGLVTIPDRPTITKQRLIGLAQHRHQQQLFRMDHEDTGPLEQQYCEKILETYTRQLKKADIVCLQDYNKGLLSLEMCREMISLAGEADTPVFVDPAADRDYSKYSNATIITPNRQEASGAVGISITDQESASRAASKLLTELKLQAVVITLDKEGAYLKTAETDRIFPTKVRNVYDVTGAGDMVLATLAVTLAAGCDYETAVQLANITGGLEVEKFGVATVTIEEIINEIISRNRGKNGKVRKLDALLREVQWHRRQKETIVFTNGCFDVLHRGHIEFLEFCKAQGDYLVVGLNSDSSVKRIKGQSRPINNQFDRAAILAAMETVDYITVFDQADPLELITKIKPDVLVKGQDWEDKGVVGREFVESYHGKVVLAPMVEGKSSTSTIEKIKSMEEKS